MANFVATPTRTFTASGALSQYRRVHLDGSGQLEYCSAAHTDCVGTLETDALAADEEVAVRLTTAQGTQIMIASKAIAKGAAVYAAASGKISDSGTVAVGEALEAATANNDAIEVLPA